MVATTHVMADLAYFLQCRGGRSDMVAFHTTAVRGVWLEPKAIIVRLADKS